ncbi:hypothetical protein PITCH_A1950002 [uncultured Desulfobacterium sp.]|uniref:Uncharacterized protein n=1 Tax=uncultured Desulfobacterium sp. TaxID=201089 RepID=A0A445MWI6_9BACT|nr:hypothetical protein PITCH_A1950002 [uncultured Desulfobacterium sp.]
MNLLPIPSIHDIEDLFCLTRTNCLSLDEINPRILSLEPFLSWHLNPLLNNPKVSYPTIYPTREIIIGVF